MNLLRCLVAISTGFCAGLKVIAVDLAPQPLPSAAPEPSAGFLAPAVRESAVPRDARGPRQVTAPAAPLPPVAPEPDAPAVTTTFDSVNFDENAAATGF